MGPVVVSNETGILVLLDPGRRDSTFAREHFFNGLLESELTTRINHKKRGTGSAIPSTENCCSVCCLSDLLDRHRPAEDGSRAGPGGACTAASD